ncbi:MAG: 5'/3'-nucleotidase SurE [Chloroflexi bacterium]|nr:5'/3'-nucleotidase SurE [Chloroflexota bacterium]
MHILVTNDDGIDAPGLLALAQAVLPLGKVSVVAPDRNWSMCGHVKTIHRRLPITETRLADGTPAIATGGAPSDCVAMAVMGLLPEPVDLVVSGVNPFANIGHDLTYSGTVTAAMEAVIWGVPGLAFSLDGQTPTGLDYSACTLVAREVVQRALQNGIPAETLLNVNIPNLPYAEIKGYQITRQGRRIYRDALIEHPEENGLRHLSIGGEPPVGVPEEGTDSGALSQGCVSITPIQLDLTAYTVMQTLEKWNWS